MIRCVLDNSIKVKKATGKMVAESLFEAGSFFLARLLSIWSFSQSKGTSIITMHHFAGEQIEQWPLSLLSYFFLFDFVWNDEELLPKYYLRFPQNSAE